MIRPLHQGISVPDIDASVEWYSEVLGFEKTFEEFADFLNARIVFMRLGEFEIELFQYMGADGKPLPPERCEPNEDLKTCGVKHVAWRADDMDALVKRLNTHGVDFATPVMDMHGQKVLFIRDNSGVLIEFIQK